MRWIDVPETYSEALEEGFSTFETEYRGLGGWAMVRSLFEGALEEKAEVIKEDFDEDIQLETGEVLLSERENGIDGYVAVLYKNFYGSRKPIAKAPLQKHENFRDEYTGTHKPDEIGIPGNTTFVDVDGTNLRYLLAEEKE